MGVLEKLIAAKALIDTPEKWGKGRGMVPPKAGFCALGACGEVSAGWRAPELLGDALPLEWHGRAVHDFNDAPTTTHADIMALFDRAIAKAGASHV